MLKWLLSGIMSSGLGDRFDGGTGGSLANLTAMLADEKKKGDEPHARLQDAFNKLKDMHKDDPRLAEGLSMMPSSGGASALDHAQWPFGPVGAPRPMAAPVPTPQPRPAQAPMSPQEADNIYDSFENSPAGKRMRAADMAAPASSGPFADFFARNAAMMKDPTTGEMIDPSAAAKFGGGGILNGMFG